MSVPKSKRKESNIQYLYDAVQFSNMATKVIIKMPKRWREYKESAFSTTTSKLLEYCATANAIAANDEQEYKDKILYLRKAKGQSDVLQILLNEILDDWRNASEQWKRSIDDDNKNIKKPSILCIKENTIIQLSDACIKLNNSLGNSVNYNKQKLKKLNKNTL